MKKETIFNTAKSLAIIFVAIISFAIVSGIIRSLTVDDKPSEDFVMPKQMETSLIEKADQFDSDKLKEGYMTGCLSEDPAQETFCLCSYNYILNNFGKEDLITMALELETAGDLSKESADIIVDAAYSCIEEYKY